MSTCSVAPPIGLVGARAAGILSRAGILLDRSVRPSGNVRILVRIVRSARRRPASPLPGSDQASFLQSLAGPSEAPMYPSGLIWDPTFPTTGGPIPAVVVADTGYNRITVFDPTACPMPDTSTCAPIESFGSEGTADGQFNTDRDVAVDANSNIYVADAANSRIEAFTAAGTWLWSAGDAADCGAVAACELDVPIGISYDATTNEVLVADTGHSEIKAYAAVGGAYGFTDGQYIWELPAGIVASPREARRGPDGEIWIADYPTRRCAPSSARARRRQRWARRGHHPEQGDRRRHQRRPRQWRGQLAIQHRLQPRRQHRLCRRYRQRTIGVFDITNCNGRSTARRTSARSSKYRRPVPYSVPAAAPECRLLRRARRVAVDPATGNIWAADFSGSGIHEFSPTGSTSGMYEIDGSPAPQGSPRRMASRSDRMGRHMSQTA